MALKADVKTKLTSTLKGFDVDKLIAAIVAADEQDYEIPDVSVLTTDELNTRDTNKINEGKKAGETTGETKGKELAAKAIKKAFNLTSDTKEIDKIAVEVNALLNKGDAGLQDQIKLLQADKTRLESEVTTANGKATQAAHDAELITYFPANANTDLTVAERLALVKMNLQFDQDNGVAVVKRNGTIIRDAATQNAVDAKTAVVNLFTEKKWISDTNQGGRGGGNSGGGGTGTAGAKTLSGFNKGWKEANPGKNDVSPEYDAALSAHTKGMTDFDYNT